MPRLPVRVTSLVGQETAPSFAGAFIELDGFGMVALATSFSMTNYHGCFNVVLKSHISDYITAEAITAVSYNNYQY